MMLMTGIVIVWFSPDSGVYVAAVVHDEDRVLVADDGRVPMVEVDDAVAVSDASLTADYYWLLKVGHLLHQ